jgi:hypothetical protein
VQCVFHSREEVHGYYRQWTLQAELVGVPGAGSNGHAAGGGAGLAIAAQIVEAVTGTTYWDYVHEHVFGCSGMIGSGFYTRTQWLTDEHIAHSYMLQADGSRVDAVRNVDKDSLSQQGPGEIRAASLTLPARIIRPTVVVIHPQVGSALLRRAGGGHAVESGEVRGPVGSERARSAAVSARVDDASSSSQEAPAGAGPTAPGSRHTSTGERRWAAMASTAACNRRVVSPRAAPVRVVATERRRRSRRDSRAAATPSNARH